MKETRLTIFTPAWNRAHCIGHLYESLKRQSCHNFIWIVVDDGSTDNLRELVGFWQEQEQQFPIFYYYKENGGMYTAYNLALSHVQTDYWVCVDSDDWMPDNAVDIIYRNLADCEETRSIGIVGLDASASGNILGGYFPENIGKTVHLLDLKLRIRHNGDMKMVYRTDITKKFCPMPEISGEKDFNPYYMMLQLDEIAPLYVVNQVICIVDYQKNGMSQNVWNAYRRSPISYGMLRLEYLRRKNLPFFFTFKQCVHYVSSWIFTMGCSEKRGKLKAPVHRPMMILAWIPGLLLNLLIRYKTRRKGDMNQ